MNIYDTVKDEVAETIRERIQFTCGNTKQIKVDKLKSSLYFVSCLEDMVGKIYFDAGQELTCTDQKNIISEAFDNIMNQDESKKIGVNILVREYKKAYADYRRFVESFDKCKVPEDQIEQLVRYESRYSTIGYILATYTDVQPWQLRQQVEEETL